MTQWSGEKAGMQAEPRVLRPRFERNSLGMKHMKGRMMPILVHVCSFLIISEAFVIPSASEWSVPRLERGVSDGLDCRLRSTWLAATEIASPSSTDFRAPVARPSVTLTPGDGVTVTKVSDNIIIVNANANEDNEIEEESSDDDDDDKEVSQEGDASREAEMIRRAAAAATLLLGRTRAGMKQPSASDTSVGVRRVGSATRSRSKGSSTSKLLGTVRTVAAASASTTSDTTNTTSSASTENGDSTSGTKTVTKKGIQAAIAEMLKNQKPQQDDDTESGRSTSMNAFREPLGLGTEMLYPLANDNLQNPVPGTVLLHSSAEIDPALKRKIAPLTVRVATPEDDMDIANLRLSVFSDFSPEIKKQFCSRSCQVLATRRLRGATCLVATVPIEEGQEASRSDIILGSVECSVHEFVSTALGCRRPKDSVLYITEVAVSPSARRCGVGTKLLQGVDELATLRQVETLYLHVDVLNFGALKLYRRAGYRKVERRNPMYLEFTTSLNLHDGATKGRSHFLLYKHMTKNPTWLPPPDKNVDGYGSSGASGTLGFEIII